MYDGSNALWQGMNKTIKLNYFHMLEAVPTSQDVQVVGAFGDRRENKTVDSDSNILSEHRSTEYVTLTIS